MDENKIRHLEFIQNIIQRMNSNSFQIKGLAVAIITALLSLYAANNEIVDYLLVPIVPTLILWILDGFYLSKERQFIELYNSLIGVGEKEIDIQPFEITFEKTKSWKNSSIVCMFSISCWIIYIPIITFFFIAYLNK